MKNILLHTHKKKCKCGVIAVLCVALFALAVGMTALPFDRSTQKAEASVSNANTHAVTALNNPSVSKTISMTDSVIHIESIYLSQTGWLWEVRICEYEEKEVADVWDISKGKNYKQIAFELTTNPYDYDLKSLVSSGQIEEGITYCVGVLGMGVDGSIWVESEVYTYMYRTPVDLPPDPIKEGYHFVGWFYDAAFTRPYDNKPIYEDTALYAKMEINTYTVTFDSAGGSPVSSSTVDWNCPVQTSTPTRTGYDFEGWYTEDGASYNGEGIRQDTKLVAQWKIKIFTVTFYLEGEQYASLQVPYGASLKDVVSQNTLDVEYYNLFNENGTALGGQTMIDSAMTINAVRMTAEEASATFFAKHNWLLWLWGAVTAIGVLGFVICIVYIKKAR